MMRRTLDDVLAMVRGSATPWHRDVVQAARIDSAIDVVDVEASAQVAASYRRRVDMWRARGIPNSSEFAGFVSELERHVGRGARVVTVRVPGTAYLFLVGGEAHPELLASTLIVEPPVSRASVV